ncbi:hypothetical protein [Desulfonema magnum]|uniref:Uncharacterized protein n=1 Tax=Desulfonema magnum TaxID=45655 RepID=A0A975GMZ4_9BACT|nr:hypothetical protein [Desulfonema magnum]QTA87240.1 Uncharacterized protein dnm_032700 [Desulfonema magnum]
MEMDTIVFGNYSVQDVLIAAGVIIALLILISAVRKLFKKEKVSEHIQVIRCKNCGWRGQVSRYAGRCPKCNEPLGDQLAKH